MIEQSNNTSLTSQTFSIEEASSVEKDIIQDTSNFSEQEGIQNHADTDDLITENKTPILPPSIKTNIKAGQMDITSLWQAWETQFSDFTDDVFGGDAPTANIS